MKYKAYDLWIKDGDEHTLKDFINNSKECKKMFETQSSVKSVPKKAPETQRPKALQVKSSKIVPNFSADTDLILSSLAPNTSVHGIYKKCLESNQPFIDTDFPAKLDSITTDEKEKKNDVYKTAIWRRPHEFMKCDYSQIKLFDNIDPNDIQQGQLGVSYLLSCLSCLAEFPTRLMDMFIIKEGNKFGVYAVQFCVDGVPTEVIIDDLFPCLGHNQDMPVFTRNNGKELWAMILEKAWGKLFKHYLIAGDGHPAWAFQYLTKAPSTSYKVISYNDDALFKLVLEADQKNWLINCSVSPGNTLVDKMGLVKGHAYSILSVYDLGTVKLLKLRNPWGKQEFQGDYSEKSTKWTDEFKKKVGFVQAEDGMFFMSIQEFKKNFDSISICYSQDDWNYTYDKAELDHRHASYYEFELYESSHVYIRVHQTDERFKKVSDRNYKYSPTELSLFSVKSSGNLIDLIQEKDQNAFTGAQTIHLANDAKGILLDPGKYLIKAKVEFLSQKKESFTVSVYSEKRVDLRKVPGSYREFYKKAVLGLVSQQSKNDLGNQLGYVDGWYNLNTFYFAICNDSRKSVDMVWTLLNDKDFRFKKYSKANASGENVVKLKINAGQWEVVIVKMKNKNVQSTPMYNHEFK